jgi:hypothetical protein
VFFGTTGDIEVNVTIPGFAVKVEIPREFVPIRSENDTSFVWSTITEDYWYYNVTDMAQHYPYDPNAPWYVIIWSLDLTGFFAPQIVRLKNMVAAPIAGLYNVTVYVATSLSSSGKPIFSQTPTEVLTILVCMSRDWAAVYGYVYDDFDKLGPKILVKAKGVVYGENQETGEVARAFINATTGFFNLTGLRPGTYKFRASAGYFAATGCAYSLTPQLYPPMPLLERQRVYADFTVDRGGIVSGTIDYLDWIGDPIKSLDHPWLKSLGFSAAGVLNWTVEAYDQNGKLIALDLGNTNGMFQDPFSLVVGKTWRYVGADPVGTEFCGIGRGAYNIVAHVFAYVQKQAPPLVTISFPGQVLGAVSIRLRTGGVISGTIRFFNPSFSARALETPRQSEISVLSTSTGGFYGGNVLVEAYDLASSELRGVYLMNGTSRSGLTLYADQNTLTFHILGFSDYYNRTYSGFWRVKDCGLDGGSYSVKVKVRGYSQVSDWDVTLALGGDTTLSVDMVAGGAISVIAQSAIPWPGTYRMQMLVRWVLLELGGAYRARFYYYDRDGFSLGYTEAILRLGEQGVSEYSVAMIFTGMNYPLDQLIYLGWKPTCLSPGMYSVKAFLYGYLQVTVPTVFVYGLARVLITLLVACETHATVILTRSEVFYPLAENVSYRVRVTDIYGNLKGGQIGNAMTEATSISFSCRGFGGLYHFFYVTPEGTRWYDYGIDKGNHTIVLERFGYHQMFERVSGTVQFNMLNTAIGFVWRAYLLNKIYGIVYGLNIFWTFRLSWATILVESFGEATTSFDGAFWVFVPDGESMVKCSLVGYADQSKFEIARGGSAVGMEFVLEPV